jgi:hypothetical protein
LPKNLVLPKKSEGYPKLLGALFSIIGAIVVAALNEAGGHPFHTYWTSEPKLVAPFNEMGSPEYIAIIRTAPNRDCWRRSNWIVSPINQSLSGGNFDELARLNCSRRKEEWFLYRKIIRQSPTKFKETARLRAFQLGYNPFC